MAGGSRDKRLGVRTDDQRQRALARLRPHAERATAFSGSHFAEADVRPLGPALPWSYEALVRDRARGRASVLDMGTGGGERLSDLRPSLPANVVATEEWKTNVPVASRRLAPLGVRIVRCSSLRLPFAAAAFDLVLNRHEELDPREVARVLRPGGCVITQQIGRNEWCELREFLPRMANAGELQQTYRRGFEAAGLAVTESAHCDSRVAFGTLGDVVYMLLVSPWTIPDLSLERDLDALLALEDACARDEGLVLTESRFLLVATKPADGPPKGV